MIKNWCKDTHIILKSLYLVFGTLYHYGRLLHPAYEKANGSLQKNYTQYYISSGMGIRGGKFRIATQSEYVVLTIEKDKNTR